MQIRCPAVTVRGYLTIFGRSQPGDQHGIAGLALLVGSSAVSRYSEGVRGDA